MRSFLIYSSPIIVRVIMLQRMRWVGLWHLWGVEKCIQNFGEEMF